MTDEKKNNGDKHVKIALISFFPALIVTGAIVVPIMLFFEHLELSGKLKLPDWLVWPAIFAIVGLFRFVWMWSAQIIGKRFDTRHPKDEQKQ